MNWDSLPIEIKNLILENRRKIMYFDKCALKIQSEWRDYRSKVLIDRFYVLNYIKDVGLYSRRCCFCF